MGVEAMVMGGRRDTHPSPHTLVIFSHLLFWNYLQASDVSISLASFEISSLTSERYFYS